MGDFLQQKFYFPQDTIFYEMKNFQITSKGFLKLMEQSVSDTCGQSFIKILCIPNTCSIQPSSSTMHLFVSPTTIFSELRDFEISQKGMNMLNGITTQNYHAPLTFKQNCFFNIKEINNGAYQFERNESFTE